jgi:hypothetical protein
MSMCLRVFAVISLHFQCVGGLGEVGGTWVGVRLATRDRLFDRGRRRQRYMFLHAYAFSLHL